MFIRLFVRSSKRVMKTKWRQAYDRVLLLGVSSAEQWTELARCEDGNVTVALSDQQLKKQ